MKGVMGSQVFNHIMDKIKINPGLYKKDGVKELNKMNFQGSMTMLALMYAFFVMEIALGGELVRGFIVFTISNIVFHGAASIIYFRDKESKNYKKILMIAFFITYSWLMFGYENNLVCILIIPPLVMTVLYHDILFSAITGILTFLYNLGFALFMMIINDFSTPVVVDSVFQVVLMLLVVQATVFATYIYHDSYVKNQDYFIMLQNKTDQLANITMQTIETLSNAIDAKDHYTEGHSIRVSEYSVEIAKQMGIEGDELEYIKYSSLLHDVGKISVPDKVLNKPARLSEEEFGEMKTHTTAGGDILSMISTIPGIANSALYHHEKYDGTGYPRGLAGEEIPTSARIIALADAYDAMTTDRVYRKRLSQDEVIKEIKNASGTQFDPKVVKAFFKYLNEQEDNNPT